MSDQPAAAVVRAERRRRLMQTIGPRAVAIFRGGPEARRNGDVHYRYRPSSDVMYLSGFAEPDTTVVLAPGRLQPFVLFVRPRDRDKETWTGRRAGVVGATRDYGADAAHPVAELRAELAKILDGADEVWYTLGEDRAFDALLVDLIGEVRARERRGARAPRRIVDPRDALHEQRLFKSPLELDLMRRAAAITAEAHRAAIRAARPGRHEYEVEAEIEYTFRRRGAFGAGYPTIVGSGRNATILHYIENQDELHAGDLVLVDAGAEVDCYTADVTRTFPCGGRFSETQRGIYDLVLAAELEAIELCRPGTTLDAIHDAVVRRLVQGLVELGLLSGEPSQLIDEGRHKRFYMHRTSHWLGMDVHDAGRYGLPGEGAKARPLEPGMVLTIEPGLYLMEGDLELPAAYRGIGVRIEDDVVITSGAPEVLTAAAPKDPLELERLTTPT